jgi:hypothetical protein
LESLKIAIKIAPYNYFNFSYFESILRKSLEEINVEMKSFSWTEIKDELYSLKYKKLFEIVFEVSAPTLDYRTVIGSLHIAHEKDNSFKLISCNIV